jgi:RES domain-containing protein
LIRVWRICKTVRIAAAWDGDGARRVGGRWNHRGVPIVYASATLSLAALEFLVHVDPDIAPSPLSALAASLPERLAVETWDIAALPGDWRAVPAPTALRDRGSAWAVSRRTAVARAPSALIPGEWNYLLNPRHPDFESIQIEDPVDFSFDPRLL